MSTLNYSTVVLLTYAATAGVEARGYHQWLRDVDNPFFNRIPDIAHYSNWKIVAHDGGQPPFTHFDLVGLTSWDRVESVWFNPELDEFRDGWAEKWGYGSGGTPTPVNSRAYLARRQGTGNWVFDHFVLVTAGSHAGGNNAWRIEESLRKPWFFGRAPATEPWRWPLEEDNPLGFDAFSLTFSAEAPDVNPPAPDAGMRWVGQCIAAPDLTDPTG